MLFIIRKTIYGYQVKKGLETIKSTENPLGPGYIMPGFRLYELRTFKTHKQALSYIEKNKKTTDQIRDLTLQNETTPY